MLRGEEIILGTGPDLFTGEIYIEIFGLKPDYLHPEGKRLGRPKFRNEDQKKVNCVRVGTYISLKKLRERGLIRTQEARIDLTEAGLIFAKNLTD